MDISVHTHLQPMQINTVSTILYPHGVFTHVRKHTHSMRERDRDREGEREEGLFGVMKTLWLNPNLHIEFDLLLKAALIFPLSHTVQCTASDTPMKISLFDLICKFLQWTKRDGREEEECMVGIRRLGCIAWWGYREGVSEYAPLMYFMFARMEANGRMATVREFFSLWQSASSEALSSWRAYKACG